MVKINKIVEEPCSLYFENSQNEMIYLGKIKSDFVLDDVRIQICEENSDKYSILFKDKFYKFNRFGNFNEQWPIGLFQVEMNTIGNLLKKQIQKKRFEREN